MTEPGVPTPYPFPAPRPTNGLAIASLIVGIVSVVSCPLAGLIAIYLGNRARAQIAQTGEDGDGLARAGVILGWITVGIAVLFMILLGGFIAIVAAGGGWTN